MPGKLLYPATTCARCDLYWCPDWVGPKLGEPCPKCGDAVRPFDDHEGNALAHSLILFERRSRADARKVVRFIASGLAWGVVGYAIASIFAYMMSH